ncbi:MAG: hypothetical protein ACFFCW_01850 [Candidatus Hodarchaeota archaeon]
MNRELKELNPNIFRWRVQFVNDAEHFGELTYGDNFMVPKSGTFASEVFIDTIVEQIRRSLRHILGVQSDWEKEHLKLAGTMENDAI